MSIFVLISSFWASLRLVKKLWRYHLMMFDFRFYIHSLKKAVLSEKNSNDFIERKKPNTWEQIVFNYLDGEVELVWICNYNRYRRSFFIITIICWLIYREYLIQSSQRILPVHSHVVVRCFVERLNERRRRWSVVEGVESIREDFYLWWWNIFISCSSLTCRDISTDEEWHISRGCIKDRRLSRPPSAGYADSFIHRC